MVKLVTGAEKVRTMRLPIPRDIPEGTVPVFTPAARAASSVRNDVSAPVSSSAVTPRPCTSTRTRMAGFASPCDGASGSTLACPFAQ